MKSALSDRLFYHLLAFAVVALWGVTFICTKVLIGAGLLPAQIFAIRFVIAYAGIWILCLRKKDTRRLFAFNLRDELLLVFLGISGGSIYFLTENTALAHTQACNVSFIVCIAPLITATLTLLSKKFLHGTLVDGLEDVRGRWPLIAGTVLAIGGMATVIFDGQALNVSARGDLLAFGAAACWGLYSMFMSQITAKYGSLFATRKVFFYGLVTIIPFLIGKSLDHSILARPVVWGNLLFLSLVASLACFILWNKVMSKLGNVTSTNYVYLNPFFTTIAAVLFLGESLTLQSSLGCTAIISGVILGSLRPR